MEKITNYECPICKKSHPSIYSLSECVQRHEIEEIEREEELTNIECCIDEAYKELIRYIEEYNEAVGKEIYSVSLSKIGSKESEQNIVKSFDTAASPKTETKSEVKNEPRKSASSEDSSSKNSSTFKCYFNGKDITKEVEKAVDELSNTSPKELEKFINKKGVKLDKDSDDYLFNFINTLFD